MIKKLLTIFLITALVALSGCAPRTSPKEQKQPNTQTPPAQITNKPSIGGIFIGNTKEEVAKVLGSNFKETLVEEGGQLGEPFYKIEYTKGITVIVGKTSNKVLQIDSTSPEYKTNLGTKVGDTLKDIQNTYASKYTQTESRQGDGKLEGWYNVEEEAVVIFDFNKSDETILNSNLKPESKVEMIRLTNLKFID
jgi:hypothetical protein